MSLKRKIIAALTSVAAVITLATFVSAQDVKTETKTDGQKQMKREMRGGRFGKRDGMGSRRGKKRHGMMRGLRSVNLTEDQKTQLRTIMQSRKNSQIVNREEMRTIISAKRDGTITPEQTQKLDAFKAEMKENSKRTREQILAILTPEQRTQLEAKKEEMKRRREERRQLRDQKKTTPDEKKEND